MPKAGEPSREKSTRDYMMEEMQWLANDFRREAKEKRSNAKKIARAVEKYHQVDKVRGLPPIILRAFTLFCLITRTQFIRTSASEIANI